MAAKKRGSEKPEFGKTEDLWDLARRRKEAAVARKKGLWVMDRDRRIAAVLRLAGGRLTSEQGGRLFFRRQQNGEPTTDPVARFESRANLLVRGSRAGPFMSRFRRSLPDGKTMPVWGLAALGSAAGQAELGWKLPKPLKGDGRSHLDHDLKCNELLVALAERPGGDELRAIPVGWRWLPTHAISVVKSGSSSGEGGHHVKPDAILEIPELGIRYFVEYETGSNSLDDLRRHSSTASKIGRYADLFTMVYAARYQDSDTRDYGGLLKGVVLFVTESPVRRDSILKCWGKVHYASLFDLRAVTMSEAIALLRPQTLNAEQFFRPGRRALVDGPREKAEQAAAAKRAAEVRAAEKRAADERAAAAAATAAAAKREDEARAERAARGRGASDANPRPSSQRNGQWVGELRVCGGGISSLHRRGSTFRLLRDETLSIGRAASCKLNISDDMVSWRHAEVWLSPTRGTLFIRDLQSSNGTQFGGRTFRGDTLEIGSGMEVIVGTTVLRYLQRGESPEAYTRPITEASARTIQDRGGGPRPQVDRAPSRQPQAAMAAANEPGAPKKGPIEQLRGILGRMVRK